MAEELIAATVRVLLEKAIDMIGLMMGVYDELKEMEGLAKDIQALLADAEAKQSKNTVVLLWLKSVEEAAFEAENVLDELLYESLRRQVHKTKRGSGAKVCSYFSMSKHNISFRMRMSSKVRAINVKLRDIKREAISIELVRLDNDLLLSRDTNVKVEAANRPTDSLLEQFVTGRSEEEIAIVDKLLLGSSDGNNSPVSVLAIVGMGGLGKTTLAKSIYNKGNIVNHFSKRCWVCVSDAKFEVTSILKGVLESLKRGEKVEVSSRDAIVHGIQKELNGERFLFVLDDVWNEDSRLWDGFFNSLVGLNTANGSCCVLTTRSQKAANLVCTSPLNLFVLGRLSDNDCWLIIVKRATQGREMPSEFEVHKEEILKKCQGLPLAANAIGGLLSSQRKEDWASVVEALKDTDVVDDDIMPILKLSYDYLPYPRIKKCFAYCSVLSKDTRMDGLDFIEFWMAEGYLQDNMQGRTTMEDDGAGCLKHLLQSSLLEKEVDANTGHDFYHMHDLVHDLAESISRKQHVPACRHILFLKGNMKMPWNEKSMLVQIVEGEVSGKMLLKYKHARVMNFVEIQKLPNTIGKLKHIRSLTLSLGGIKSLPESVCKLYHLQALALNGCGNLQCLPQKLSNLISLRHLSYDENEKLKMAPNMGRLTRLQTLKHFNVGEENGRGIKELGFMKNIKGSIGIHNLELVESKEAATSADLFNKKNLTTLALNWGSATNDNWEDVLEGLEPCQGLQHLKIASFMGIRSPGWLGKLSALVSLQLKDCKNITQLECSGDIGFPNLKTLRIEGCPQLSSVRTSFPILEKLEVKDVQVSAVRDIIWKSGTNSLQDINLNGVSGMRSLSDVIETSPSSCLKILEIEFCDDLTEIPSSTLECCTCMETLTVKGCPELVSCPLNLQQTPSLSVIKLWVCPKLFTRDAILPRGFEHLTNLKELWIGDFEESATMDWDGLRKGCSTTLRHLAMTESCQTQLPQQLQDFSSLVGLGLFLFDSLERLPGWLGILTSLQDLGLLDCPKLEHLPTDAIRSLTNLQQLTICRCPLLRQTQGDEIKALPNLEIDWTDY